MNTSMRSVTAILFVIAGMQLGLNAGGAGATSLCKVNENPCAASNQYPIGTVLKAHSTAVTISGSFEVTCESDIALKTVGSSGSTLEAEGTSASVTNCKGACSEGHVHWPKEIHIKQLIPPLVELLGFTILLLKCFFFFQCNATATKPTFTVDNGTQTPSLLAKNVFLKVSGEGCGTEGTFNAIYTVTSPKPVFITS